MCSVKFPVLLGMTMLGVIEARVTLPAGKCRTNITPMPVDLRALALMGKWKIIYATDTYGDIDQEIREAYVLGKNLYKLYDTRIRIDGTKDVYPWLLESVDNVVYENSIDENGKKQRFYIYPLSYDGGALLYYRCTNSSRTDIDTRIIEMPRNLMLSTAARKQLLDKDKSYGFRGDLKELPFSRTTVHQNNSLDATKPTIHNGL